LFASIPPTWDALGDLLEKDIAMKTLIKTITNIAAMFALILTIAAPASAGSLSALGLADPQVVHCDKLMKDGAKATPRKVRIVRGGSGQCPIILNADQVSQTLTLPTGTRGYVEATLRGKCKLVPFQVGKDKVFFRPWDKKNCPKN